MKGLTGAALRRPLALGISVALLAALAVTEVGEAAMG